ncbi:MAG: hypothetical protein ABI670_13155 [Chloroflexota bacterium]
MIRKHIGTLITLVGLMLAMVALAGCDLETGTTAESLGPTATATAAVVATETAVPAPEDTATTAPPTATDLPTNTPEPVPTNTPEPLPTDTQVPPTETPQQSAPTATAVATAVTEPSTIKPTPTVSADDGATPEASPTEAAAAPAGEEKPGQMVNGKWYDAYVPAATKKKQYYHYTCEFDAAWVVLKSNGIDATLEDQINIVGLDTSIEPYYEETKDGIFIYGGDILHSYSGDYKENFLARSTGVSMRRVFEHYGLRVTPVHTQDDLQAALRRGELVWIKTTADFKPGKDSTWVMPDGTTYQTVLGNDHAAVVMGYSERGALIRDVLGPTSTNWERPYEYEVPWPKFLAAWGQQQNDGLAVGR